MSPNIQIVTPSKYEVLREVVKDYPGLLNNTELLLRELHHDPRDWNCLIKTLRAYALKNFFLHDHHEKGIAAIRVIVDVFLEALHAADVSIQQAAIDSLIFYLEKMLLDGGHHLHKYDALLKDSFNKLYYLEEKQFSLLAINPHQVKKLGQIVLEKMPTGFDLESFNNLLFRSLITTYEYWLREEDFLSWFKDKVSSTLSEQDNKELEELLYPISHTNLRMLLHHVKKIEKSTDQSVHLRDLLQFPSHMQIVKFYDDIIGSLSQKFDTLKGLQLKMIFLLKIIKTENFSTIHESTLREISRTLSAVIKTEEPDYIKEVLSETLQVLKDTLTTYSEAALYLIHNIGSEIFDKGDSNLVEWFIQGIVSLGFQYPKVAGVTEEWQVKVNKAHLKNIRVWLELIEKNPKWAKSLISALIINLRLSGVHMSDIDLFQKDITNLLNSDIEPTYNLIKQLTKLFPVYFSDINAEGVLREVSTEIDEVIGRADPLVHFLRKQSHVESNARVVDSIEETIKFWLTRDKNPLKGFLPENIFSQVNPSGSHYDEISTIFHAIFKDKNISEVTDLLSLSEEEIVTLTDGIPHVSEKEKRRAFLAVKFYQLIHKKYRLDLQDIRTHLSYAQGFGLPSTDSLVRVLEDGNIYQRLHGTLTYLQGLKDIILSSERYEPVEDIFRKRHIAAGIPSVSGRYHERKFDALSLTLRLENLANTLFEELIDTFHLRFITRASLFQIKKYMSLFSKALQLDGIYSNRLEKALELLSGALEVRRFSFSQYTDIFRSFSEAVQDILNSYYFGIHKHNLKHIILQMGPENILPKYLEAPEEESEFEFTHKVSEKLLREVVASSFAIQQLDNFISKILKIQLAQEEGLDIQNLDLLMSYDPKKAISPIHTPNKATNDRIHLGNKGYNLLKLASLGIPVPPGFIITTEVFRCQDAIKRFGHAREHLDEKITEQISRLEEIAGKSFGDPENPLLVSVRSGAAISMPGMMLSFLNVGLNESTVKGLIRQTAKPWFAWDCYRRFLQCWGMSYGLERDKFDDIINSFKRKYKVVKKIQFTPDQMKEVAIAYREFVTDMRIEIIDDPRIQLKIAIDQVFQSWFSKKAQAYREVIGLSENWGTAVIVQTMVYGNLDVDSGTGVLFTRNPQEIGDRVMLWGDFAVGSQGEDVVAGLVKTLPLSNEQRDIEDRRYGVSLESSFNQIYQSLLKITKDLIYNKRWGAQEIEFTFEGTSPESLYILQARDMAVTKRESFMAFIPSPKLSSSFLCSGIGVGGGALSGRAVFDLDDIKEFRDKDPLTPLILIRSDTVPDDIRHISAADGLLTARGGSTSHAAIVANRLGKTCVVGCNALLVWEYEKKCVLKRHKIHSGDFLSIDGRNGSIYLGRHQVKEVKLLT